MELKQPFAEQQPYRLIKRTEEKMAEVFVFVSTYIDIEIKAGEEKCRTPVHVFVSWWDVLLGSQRAGLLPLRHGIGHRHCD